MTSSSGYRSATAEWTSNALLIVTLFGTVMFAIWLASTSSWGVPGGILLFIVGLFVGGVVAALVFTGVDHLLKTPEQRSVESQATKAAEVAAQERGVPVRKWRGLSHMTRAQHVDAFCSRCHHSWHLEGRVANTIADTQGLGNRLVRGGTKTEQIGATFTVGASGRRIAAGLESQRQQEHLGAIMSMALCPSCGRLDGVHLRKDRNPSSAPNG